MENKVLMTLSGNKLISNTWKQELQIREDGIHGEILVVGKRTKMFLTYEDIAQVNITRGVFFSDMEIINRGGSSNLIIKALKKKEAEEAKEIIDQKIKESKLKPQGSGVSSQADEIKKLAELRDQGIITEEDFQLKKKQIINM